MKAGILLAIVGPMFAAVGGAILVYDTIRGPIRWFEQVFIPSTTRRTWRKVFQVYRDLPRPPYTEGEVAYLLINKMGEAEENLQTEEDKQAQTDLAHALASRRRAVWGFILIVAGSLMQSVAAWLSK